MDPLGWVCEIGRGEIAIARLFNPVSPRYSSESQLLRAKIDDLAGNPLACSRILPAL
jgi:hypothetical protein